MDEPLFGERQQKAQIALYAFGGFVTLFVLFSVIVAFIFGVKEREHFVIACALICVYVILCILVKWYRDGDLDPKFKYLIIFVLITVLLTAVAVNTYVWIPKPKPPQLPTCDGLYRFSDGVCFPNCSGENECLSTTAGHCVTRNCSTTITGKC